MHRYWHSLATGGHVVSAFAFTGEYAGSSSRIILIENPKIFVMVVSTSVTDCQVVTLSSAWFAAFAIPLNGLLFFFRIRAVFNDTKSVVWFFAFLWVAVLGCALTTPFGVKATYPGVEEPCLDLLIAKFVSLGPIASWIYDTLVFIAISTKLMSFSFPTKKATWRERIKCFWTGPERGFITRTVLQTGQLYYL